VQSTERIQRILDAKYEKLNIQDYIKEHCEHLAYHEQQSLNALLKRHEPLFDGTLGDWKNEEYDIELQPGVKPYYGRAYPIPKAYEETVKLECERLCKLGILRKVNCSQ
jgi:hypothetical protein